MNSTANENAPFGEFFLSPTPTFKRLSHLWHLILPLKNNPRANAQQPFWIFVPMLHFTQQSNGPLGFI